jgi:hypothetical protein
MASWMAEARATRRPVEYFIVDSIHRFLRPHHEELGCDASARSRVAVAGVQVRSEAWNSDGGLGVPHRLCLAIRDVVDADLSPRFCMQWKRDAQVQQQFQACACGAPAFVFTVLRLLRPALASVAMVAIIHTTLPWLMQRGIAAAGAQLDVGVAVGVATFVVALGMVWLLSGRPVGLS